MPFRQPWPGRTRAGGWRHPQRQQAENVLLFSQIGGPIRAVAVQGYYACVSDADGQEGQHIFDVSNPAAPSEVGFYTPGEAAGVGRR